MPTVQEYIECVGLPRSRCNKVRVRHGLEPLPIPASPAVNVALPRMDHKQIPAKSRGLGDTIAKFTQATGIKRAVDAVSKATGIPCGCGKRQEKLNQIFPYNTKESE
jgi:hypothetical protein